MGYICILIGRLKAEGAKGVRLHGTGITVDDYSNSVGELTDDNFCI